MYNTVTSANTLVSTLNKTCCIICEYVTDDTYVLIGNTIHVYVFIFFILQIKDPHLYTAWFKFKMINIRLS